jgi:galactosylxylosylprotein 3-beta-galactosyltransferase
LDPNHQDDEALRQGFHGLKRHKAFLVVVILSAAPHQQQRQAIRETWLDISPSLRTDVLYFFVVGTLGLSDVEQTDLDAESAQHKDLLKLPVAEEFQRLTNKILTTFVQIDRNVQFKYLLKVDDDTFVRVGDVVDELKHSNYETLFYWGFFDGRAPVIRQVSRSITAQFSPAITPS